MHKLGQRRYEQAAVTLAYDHTPLLIKRGLARHEVPVFRLARLAVDLSVQGCGFGGQLLLAAGDRCLLVASEVGGVALLIDAKNEQIVQWYIGYGALQLFDQPLSLLLPFKPIHAAPILAGKL